MKSRVFELYHFCLDGPASCKVNIAIMAKASVYVEHRAVSDPGSLRLTMKLLEM